MTSSGQVCISGSVIQPVKSGLALLEEIEGTESQTPCLWWLGQCGFVVKYYDIIFYIDPLLSNRPGRLMASPLPPAGVRHADLILCTHGHSSHMDPGSLPYMMAASPRARLVIPKSIAGRADAIGVEYRRMTTTDADLRVEYFKEGVYGRVYAVPSAHEELNWTPIGGYPYLGYLLRFDNMTIYHAGDCVPYDGLVDRLRLYNVTVALLPINGRDPERGMPGNFTIPEAAQLAEDIGAKWLVPMHYGMFDNDTVDINRFIEHMLGQRPAQPFKIFECGEGWPVPPLEDESI